MSKALFSVSYEITPEKRGEYLELMKEIKTFVKKAAGVDFTVYEDAERPFLMSEVYHVEDKAKIKKIKEIQDNKAESLFSQIDNFMLDPSQVVMRSFEEAV
ncbi:MAG: hypothetical protein GY863_13150 [bacterium]|nr:hypothetical protein [bacterium]